MPVGDLLNWDFLLSQYTDKQREKILQREEMLEEIQKEALQRQEEGDLNDEENLKEEAYYSFMKYHITKNKDKKRRRSDE